MTERDGGDNDDSGDEVDQAMSRGMHEARVGQVRRQQYGEPLRPVGEGDQGQAVPGVGGLRRGVRRRTTSSR
ncbi:MAG TPA: hypothetical protein VFI00_05380, partial [Kribbella sp.]|nr:hypothetical protein [Kribbella sp.]